MARKDSMIQKTDLSALTPISMDITQTNDKQMVLEKYDGSIMNGWEFVWVTIILYKDSTYSAKVSYKLSYEECAGEEGQLIYKGRWIGYKNYIACLGRFSIDLIQM
jgi:hypothetical protein